MPNTLAVKEVSAGRESIWQQLPDSVLYHILSFLPANSLLKASQSCKVWHRVAHDDYLWRNLFYTYFKVKSSISRAPGKLSWYSEYKRLFYHTPKCQSEQLFDHKDQVLHVSFSHNGLLFSTSSKDGKVMVWSSGYPATQKYYADMKEFTWKYTQYSQFNETDTLLLVSGVHFGSQSTSGEIAVFNLVGGFTLQCRVQNKPYDIFGTWFNNSYLLSGTLQWLAHLTSCSVLWLNKAFQALESQQESIVMKLFKFRNINASSIRTIMVARCLDNQTSHQKFVDREDDIDADSRKRHISEGVTIDGSDTEHHDCSQGQSRKKKMNKVLSQKMQLFHDGSDHVQLLEVDDDSCDANGTIEYNVLYREAQSSMNNSASQDYTCEVSLSTDSEDLDVEMAAGLNTPLDEDSPLLPGQDSILHRCVDDARISQNLTTSQKNSSGNTGFVVPPTSCADNSKIISLKTEYSTEEETDDTFTDAEFLSCEEYPSWDKSSNSKTSIPMSQSDHYLNYLSDRVKSKHNIDEESEEDGLEAHCNSSTLSNDDQTLLSSLCHDCKRYKLECLCAMSEISLPRDTGDKYLIFTTGMSTYTPHQIGIKRISTKDAEEMMHLKADSHPDLPPPAPLACTNGLQEGLPAGDLDEDDDGDDSDDEPAPPILFDTVDHLIELHGHIIGMCLSPDSRYLYVNSRPWPQNYQIEDPLYPPPIAQEIDIHVIDLLTMEEVGTMHRAHKAYTPNDECFFIFLDVCDQYVASGAEDKHGYLWDRHYGICIDRFPHEDVVNSVAFNPCDSEMMITASDDNSIKIWRSKNRMKQLNISDQPHE